MARKRMKPRQRPPTKWIKHCVEKVARASKKTKAVATKICASNWWHKMSPKTRQAAFDKHEAGGAHAPTRREAKAKTRRRESARERARRLARILPRRKDGKFLPLKARGRTDPHAHLQDHFARVHGLFIKPDGTFKRLGRSSPKVHAPRKAARSRKGNYCRVCRGPHRRHR